MALLLYFTYSFLKTLAIHSQVLLVDFEYITILFSQFVNKVFQFVYLRSALGQVDPRVAPLVLKCIYFSRRFQCSLPFVANPTIYEDLAI